MKKFILFAFLIISSLANCYADSGKVKVKDYQGNVVGNVEWSSQEGSRIEREGWGNCYKVTVYNNSNETVYVTVIFKGISTSESETLPPYKESTFTFYVGDNNDSKGYELIVART